MKSRLFPLLAAFLQIGCAALPDIPSPAALLATGPSSSVPSAVRGAGEFRLRGPAGWGALRFAFLLANPDRLKIQALTPVGTLAFLLVQDREKLQMYVPMKHSWLADGEARSLLEDFLPPEITTANLVYFLCGRIPASIRGWEPVGLEPEGRILRLRLRGKEGQAEAEYSRRSLGLKTLRFLDREGRPAYQIRFRDYQETAGFSLPARIDFSIPDPEGTTSFRIDLHEMEINPELAEDEFQIPATEPAR